MKQPAEGGEPQTEPRARGQGTEPSGPTHADVPGASEAILRERISRLEASIAFWAADLDEFNAENERLGAERDSLRRQLRVCDHRRHVAEDARATLEVALDDRDERIRVLQKELVQADHREIHARTTRARLHALRERVRSRLESQRNEIEDLRRMLALGHAARLQVEKELRRLSRDRERDGRYLDQVEEKLREALANESQGPGRG